MASDFALYLDDVALVEGVDYTESNNGTHYLFNANYMHSRHFLELFSNCVNFSESEFEITIATTPKELLELRKSGWQKYDEITVNETSLHFYCKPRLFRGLQ